MNFLFRATGNVIIKFLLFGCRGLKPSTVAFLLSTILITYLVSHSMTFEADRPALTSSRGLFLHIVLYIKCDVTHVIRVCHPRNTWMSSMKYVDVTHVPLT